MEYQVQRKKGNMDPKECFHVEPYKGVNRKKQKQKTKRKRNGTNTKVYTGKYYL